MSVDLKAHHSARLWADLSAAHLDDAMALMLVAPKAQLSVGLKVRHLASPKADSMAAHLDVVMVQQSVDHWG